MLESYVRRVGCAFCVTRIEAIYVIPMHLKAHGPQLRGCEIPCLFLITELYTVLIPLNSDTFDILSYTPAGQISHISQLNTNVSSLDLV